MRNRGKLLLWVTFIALIVVVIVLVITTFGSKDNKVSGAKNATNTVLEPAVEGTYNVSSNIKDFFQRLFALRRVDKEYAELKSKCKELEIENQFMKELQQENKRLADLLGYKEDNPEYKYIHARVIAKDPGSWFMEFTINRGKKDGVEIDMAVANQSGLIGRVIEVTDTTSNVVTLIDPRSAAAGVVERSRDQGIVKVASDPESNTPYCQLEHVPNNADLIPGDVVLSSSLGGIFPKGIVIGEIKEVKLESSSVEHAVIEPAVDFGHIEDVLNITAETPLEELEQIQKEKENEAAIESGEVADGEQGSNEVDDVENNDNNPGETEG
jgi:rod shape-determining protein MreC